MALYISAARRQRRTALIAVATGVVALLLGYALGRQASPSVADRVAGVRADAAQLATRIEALPIEYDQAISGGADSVQAGVLDALDGITNDTIRTMDRASWLAASDRSEVLDAVAAVGQAARDQVGAATFEQAVSAAANELRITVGH